MGYTAGYAWFGLALVLAQLVLAIAVAWWLKQHWTGAVAWDEARARQFCTRMHDLAQELVGNVGQHTLELEALNHELESSAGQLDPSQPESAILAAVARIVSANRSLEAKLSAVEERIQEQAEKIDLQLVEARVDGLTRLANRRAFDDELFRRFAECQRTASKFCLLVVDIDHFKQFNDRFGHDAGDLVLQQVARRLSTTMREMDLVARHGGEEFAVVMVSSIMADGLRAAERARVAIGQQPYQYDGHDLHVTASIGVAEVVLESDTPATLFKRADDALYAAKQHGRNCCYYHDGQALHPIGGGPAATDRPNRKPAAKTAQPLSCESPLEPSGTAAVSPALRRSFTDALRRRMTQALAAKRPLSILLVGGPHWREPGGWLKHEHLEAALRQMGDVVVRSVRSGDVVTRFGWDQFAVILPDSNLAEAEGVEERVRTALGEADLQLPGDVLVAVCTGIAEMLPDDDLMSLTRRASAVLLRSQIAAGITRRLFDSDDSCPENSQASVLG